MENKYHDTIRQYQRGDSVDINVVASAFGLQVYPDNLTPQISGAIVKNSSLGGKSGYCIFYNQNHAPVRQRFTIAHELAHFILHKDLIGDGVTDDMLYRADNFTSKIESEANQLAAEILMPFEMINRLLASGIRDLPTLSQRMGVSLAAIKIRLGIPVFDEDEGAYSLINQQNAVPPPSIPVPIIGGSTPTA